MFTETSAVARSELAAAAAAAAAAMRQSEGVAHTAAAPPPPPAPPAQPVGVEPGIHTVLAHVGQHHGPRLRVEHDLVVAHARRARHAAIQQQREAEREDVRREEHEEDEPERPPACRRRFKHAAQLGTALWQRHSSAAALISKSLLSGTAYHPEARGGSSRPCRRRTRRGGRGCARSPRTRRGARGARTGRTNESTRAQTARSSRCSCGRLARDPSRWLVPDGPSSTCSGNVTNLPAPTRSGFGLARSPCLGLAGSPSTRRCWSCCTRVIEWARQGSHKSDSTPWYASAAREASEKTRRQLLRTSHARTNEGRKASRFATSETLTPLAPPGTHLANTPPGHHLMVNGSGWSRQLQNGADTLWRGAASRVKREASRLARRAHARDVTRLLPFALREVVTEH
jgi:hypothetical protein